VLLLIFNPAFALCRTHQQTDQVHFENFVDKMLAEPNRPQKASG